MTKQSQNKSTWDQVMAHKKDDTRHKGVANTLTKDEIETLLATIDFFDGSVKQAFFDLARARYRVFDWLAMGVQGDRIGSVSATKVLAYSFLKSNGNIDKFIDDLRVSDYQIDIKWGLIEL